MTEALEKKLAKWLETQGYPLEMKVASALSKQGFYVLQGAYYDDPETNTTREIDVVASTRDIRGHFQVSFVIECKSTRDKPWVLFTSEDHVDGNRLLRYATKPEKTHAILDEKFSQNTEAVLGLKWFVKEQRLAYGAATAFSSGDDPAYKGIMSALKASMGLCRQTSKHTPLHFIFPVVVLEGRLFEAYLDKNEENNICEIEEGFVVYHREISDQPCSSIHIVTSNHLETFCKEAKQAVFELKNLFQEEYELTGLLPNMKS
ncbi:MAG: hypothetical protein OET90_08180 [Desulfuromonadales bacterium]|nr:hypothetical protein [Desulfuromonadales bacterium]